MNLRCAVVLILAFASLDLAVADDSQVDLTVGEGVYGMVTRPWPDSPQAAPVTVTVTWKKPTAATIKFKARDIFGQEIPWSTTLHFPASTRPQSQTISFPGQLGFYEIEASIAGAIQKMELGIVPPPHPGIRRDSFFASNTSGLRSGKELDFLRAIGMKIERAHIPADPTWSEADWKKPPTGQAVPMNFDKLDKLWTATKAADLWVLPIAAYSLGPLGENDLAKSLGMWGPPRNVDEFVNTWEETLRHFPEITTYEFWNEPWIFGWTWGGTPGEYRQLQKAWCEMALRVNPQIRVVAGNSSMFVRDNVAPFPDSWKGLLQGTSNHPYGPSVADPSFRSGENKRLIDSGREATQEMGLPFYYLTEGGTSYTPPPSPELATIQKRLLEIGAQRRQMNTDAQRNSPEFKDLMKEDADLKAKLALKPEPADNIENAAKIVQYYVQAQLDGCFMGNAQWEIGYGPRWTRSNTSFSVMTNLLEDRPVVADIWPEQQLITGAIFAGPQWATDEVKTLPRAGELKARWTVRVPADRAGDNTKVAVLWGLTGVSATTLDTQGRLVLDKVDDIRAFDLTGREIPATGSTLTVPLGPQPIYLTTDKLSVVEWRDRIGNARIENLVPVNAYALSLTRPVNEAQELSVRVQNQVNRDLSGQLKIKVIGSGKTFSAPFTVPAGKLTEVPVAWPGIPANRTNQYAIELTAHVDGAGSLKDYSKRQILAEASFVPRTITIDGSLDDWKGVVPVRIDSAMLKTGVDPTAALFNPGVTQTTNGVPDSHITALVYTAYDKDNVYIAVDVNEPELSCTAGQVAVKGRLPKKVTLPYLQGVPGGLDHIATCGDVFEFAFGFRDRVPQIGRQMNDPFAWKGNFFDTDYCYAANVSTAGDQLTRLAGPDTSRRNGYQTEDVPGLGPVPGAKIKITRDDANKKTIYEIAIPRTELALFKSENKQLRFSFILFNNEKVGTNGSLAWSDMSGVFDYWLTQGSFPPSWAPTLPCQTYFGIQKP
jgi:hypothetical protein